MNSLATFAEAVESLQGHAMSMDRVTPRSAVHLRVWLPNRLAASTAAVVARRLGLRSFNPIKEAPQSSLDGSYQLVIEVTATQLAEAHAWLTSAANHATLPAKQPRELEP